jgi:lysophospholipase L1-like esterase
MERRTFMAIIAAGLPAALAALVTACSLGLDSQPRVMLRDCLIAVNYVALGDSTVEGIGASRANLNYVSRLHARLVARYPNARVKNLGVGGATSADVMTRQLDRAIQLRPDLVTLSIGPNDITRGVPVARYEQNLNTILGRLRRETGALIVVNLIPDIAVTPRFAHGPQADVVGSLTVLFNEALARKAREHGVEVVDLYLPSREEVPRRSALLSRDGYHPSDAGYARWAELMWEGIEPHFAGC